MEAFALLSAAHKSGRVGGLLGPVVRISDHGHHGKKQNIAKSSSLRMSHPCMQTSLSVPYYILTGGPAV